MKNQKGFTSLETLLAVLLAAVLTGGVVYVLASKEKPVVTSIKSPEVKKEVRSTVISEETFLLELPSGWEKSDPVKEKFVESAYYYNDKNGNYFAVEVDPGRGYSVDDTWTLAKTAAGYQVQDESSCTGGDFCTVGDSRYDIAMVTEGDHSNGHAYFFSAGNIKQETGVDTKVFKDILASFKVR